GIRDGHVTGVQTCALPILRRVQGVPDTIEVHGSILAARDLIDHPTKRLTKARSNNRIETCSAILVAPQNGCLIRPVFGNKNRLRSEERRVGKEWWIGWAVD